jgi:hypothetical protein
MDRNFPNGYPAQTFFTLPSPVPKKDVRERKEGKKIYNDCLS